MFFAAEFWVAVAFFVFVGLLMYLKVPAAMTKALDDRAEAIRTELNEARRLREQAQDLLADYQKKQREADEEAKAIIDQARAEAETMKSESARALSESIARRSKLAEEKIARAEAQALADVRAAAVEAATSAAETILRTRAGGEVGTGLIDDAIRDLKGKLN